MLPPDIACESVVRLRASTTTDSYGDTVRSWDTPVSVTIGGCSVQPVQGSENILTRDSVTSRWSLYAPLDADILSSDRIRHRGVVYEVDGSVQDWPDIFGLGHRVAILKRVDG